jgi:hypothetical protein
MFDDLAAYFVNNVKAAYKAYLDNRSASAGTFRHTRHALELATALFHFREHLPAQQAMSRTNAEARCSEYALVGDVANAAKHQQLTGQTPHGAPFITKAEEILERTIITQFFDADGMYTDVKTAVFISCTDGIERSLDEALIGVLNFWIAELQNLSIITLPAVSAYVRPGSVFVSRADAKQLDLEIVKGLEWRHAMQLLRFDTATQQSTLVDLSGMQLQMKIYVPRYSVSLSIAPPDGGEPFDLQLELADEQSATFHGLKTEAEKAAFAQSLAQDRITEIAEKVQAAMLERTRSPST